MHSFNKRFHKKAILCETRAILEKELRAIGDEYPKDQIIIQEYLDGGAKSLYSYGVFAVDGIPRAWVMANRIRQRPMDFGKSTTFAITCNIPRIEELARKILNLTHYTGLAEIEFMYDYRTEDYKFLEVNTRAWKWHNISTGLGFGFLSEMIHYYNKEKSDFRPEEKRIAWVEHTMDFAVILKEMMKGRMKWSEVVRSYRTRKVCAVWSIKDPLPAFANIAIPLWLLIKKRIKPK